MHLYFLQNIALQRKDIVLQAQVLENTVFRKYEINIMYYIKYVLLIIYQIYKLA